MANIYIPIDFTNLKDIIPEGQEIIYSTFAEVDISGGSTYTGAPHKPIKTYHEKWKSHVLITKEGIALFLDKKFFKEKGIEPYYFPLSNAGFLSNKLVITTEFKEPFRGGITIGHVFITLSLILNSEFETKSSFKTRYKEFKNTIKPYMLEQSIIKLKLLYDYLEENPEAKYQDYATATEYPLPRISYNGIKKLWKKGTPLEKIIKRWTKIAN